MAGVGTGGTMLQRLLRQVRHVQTRVRGAQRQAILQTTFRTLRACRVRVLFIDQSVCPSASPLFTNDAAAPPDSPMQAIWFRPLATASTLTPAHTCIMQQAFAASFKIMLVSRENV
jgi:hypothetical protein